MGFRKTTRGEQLTLFTPEEHQVVSGQMQRTGKKSVTEMTEEERAELQAALETQDNQD